MKGQTSGCKMTLGPALYCEKHDHKEDVFLWSHYKIVSMEMCIIEGKAERKRGRGRPVPSWASDVAKFVGRSLADAVHQAVY